MAFTVATTTSEGNGTSHTVAIPDGAASGKRVEVWFASDGTPTVTLPAGVTWTRYFTDVTTTDTTMSVFWRDVDGTEGFSGTGDTITVTTSASERTAHAAYLIDGHDTGTAPEGASSTSITAPPDPPNLDPSGWGTEESLWICGGALRFAGSFTAAPTDYTNLLNRQTAGADAGATIGSARRILSAAAENPGTFTETSGGNWVAATTVHRPAAAGGVTGTVAVTQGNQTSTAAGQLGYSGTVAVTQDDHPVAAAGQLGYSGSVAATQDDQTVAAAGQLGSSGTLAVTQDDQTVSASGTVTGAGEITGSLAVTQADQTLSAAGQLGYSGSLAATQADQTAAAAGWIEVTGTVAATQDDQTVNGSGQLGSTGTLAVTQDDQTVAAAGWIAIFGTVTVTQADQAMTAAGFFGEIPVPAGHPATIQAGAHATTAAGRHTATVDPGGHRITVPAGTHAVEVQ